MRIRIVSLSNCVHYSAFRYGRDEYNPYETYLVQIANGIPPESAQSTFTEFLQHYRPRHLGEALGCGGALTKQYPMWNFPWDEINPARFNFRTGWHTDPSDSPDILTHFSESGILRYRIDEEFFWLERAFHSIKLNGYHPWRQWSFIRARTLRRGDGTEAHLLTDGNHRAAAMSALGYDSARVYQTSRKILETECDRWPGVRSGHFTRDDALAIFRAYFNGNVNYRTAVSPAGIIEDRESRLAAESAR